MGLPARGSEYDPRPWRSRSTPSVKCPCWQASRGRSSSALPGSSRSTHSRRGLVSPARASEAPASLLSSSSPRAARRSPSAGRRRQCFARATTSARSASSTTSPVGDGHSRDGSPLLRPRRVGVSSFRRGELRNRVADHGEHGAAPGRRRARVAVGPLNRRPWKIEKPRVCGAFLMERAKGIEPSPPAWKAGALPLSYARARRQSTRFPRILEASWRRRRGPGRQPGSSSRPALS